MLSLPGLRKAQLHPIPGRVLQKKLMDAQFRYLAAGEPDAMPLEERFHSNAVRAGKSDVVKCR
jgi:hypothetical protein